MQFKNYLDARDGPSIWDSPRLSIQIDSLMRILTNNGSFMHEDELELTYDMRVLDERERLMNHFDEGTMSHTEIDRWYVFTEIFKHSKKIKIIVLMDGDISQRSLILASSLGNMFRSKTQQRYQQGNASNHRSCYMRGRVAERH